MILNSNNLLLLVLCRCVSLSGGTNTSIQVVNPEFELYVGVEGRGLTIWSHLLHALNIGLESSTKLSLSIKFPLALIMYI
jgi:hypothetical protein